ncbi:class I SAM-dependent methyltransferase [Paludisphaera rhizosphaerae]|uniref:class I SAM-dependent methyltransferase n=1 Tax=Paludisphaera rhizosphaerae TaxID=2711216 RepID=UPI0013ED229B|nr:class I SAM-dependent methyltransferase [Paludisphaera rhizosphaerae]
MISGLSRIATLHQSKGGAVTLEEFQAAINLIFHDIEATVYDVVHRRGWIDLPREFGRLARAAGLGAGRRGLRLLDVGCGTGRGTALILRSPLGPRVSQVDLLDTSARMVEKALHRARSWPVSVASHVGSVDDLDGAGEFDLILTNSVLHHIPDPPRMLACFVELLSPGGHYFQMNEPHSDALSGKVLPERVRELSAYNAAASCSLPARLASGIGACRERVRRGLGSIRTTAGDSYAYLDQVNRALLAQGVIRVPLTEDEIWSVTDIHDHSAGGVGIPDMAEALDGCELVAWHTFAFFGALRGQLPARFRRREDRLAADEDRDGSKIASVWRRAGRKPAANG